MDPAQSESKRPRITPHTQPQPSQPPSHAVLPPHTQAASSPSHSTQLPLPSHQGPASQTRYPLSHPQQHYPGLHQPHQPPPHPPPHHSHHYQHQPPPPQHPSQPPQHQLPPPPQQSLPPPPAHPSQHSSYPARSAPSPTSAQHTHAPPPHGPPLRRPEPDRRHHEQEPYAPMQHEHYRPQLPPSPVHGGHYPPHQYPQHVLGREAVVKREASGYDDPGRRSNSVGHALEGPPPMHQIQTNSHQHPPYATEQARNAAYDQGSASIPPTPGGYAARSYPPPTPVQPTYDQTPYVSQPTEIYYSSSGSKKKNTRASQACDSCRSLKAKCDETKPCKTCRDKGITCHYQATAPKAADKAQADILDGIARLEQMMNERFAKVESNFNELKSGVATKQESHFGEEQKPSPNTNSNATSEFHSIGATPHDHTTETAPSDTTMNAGYAVNTLPPIESGSFEQEEKFDSESGAPLPPGQEAIPHNHTTLAGLLLHWPAIRALTRDHLDRHYDGPTDQFPIWTEENRGALLLYGCGEDNDQDWPTARARRRANMMGETPESATNASSPTSGSDYGYIGSINTAEYDSEPSYSEEKVHRLFKSFEENMLNMHPIIQFHKLEKWKQQFLNFTHRNRSGVKRKREEMDSGPRDVRTPNYAPPPAPVKPDRSLKSALILVILALGEICEYRERVPDVVRVDEDARSVNGQMPASPMQGSPGEMMPPSRQSNYASPTYHSPNAMSMSSPVATRPTPDNASFTEARSIWRRNSDVIPGLKYFRVATDILGNNIGTNSMMNVYANIFASLYYGQLGRPLQSFAHIHVASSKLLVVMRPQMNRLNVLKRKTAAPETDYDNELVMAFWTCLQLESDLIAELALPPSGVLSYEDEIPYPNSGLIWETGEKAQEPKVQRIRDSYLAQLYLRRHLNEIHRTFYAPDPDSSNGEEHDTPGAIGADGKRIPTFAEAKAIADGIESLVWVPPKFKFDQSDAPADEILAARLRAKFWGAMMITYRPFVRQVLDFSQALRENPTNPKLATGHGPRSGPRIMRNAKTSGDINPIILEHAQKAIKALLESTRAFHGLGDMRPIITNVFGTAHAQWGNLLTLTACWKDDILGKYVNEDTLKELFVRTIWFLQESETRTSSLMVDRKILSGMYEDFWGPVPIREGRRRGGGKVESVRFVDPKHQRVFTM